MEEYEDQIKRSMSVMVDNMSVSEAISFYEDIADEIDARLMCMREEQSDDQ